MKKFKKAATLWLVLGGIYLVMELISRWLQGYMVGFEIAGMTQSYWSLTGWTSIWMLPIGGFAGLFCGFLNNHKHTKEWRMIFHSLLSLLFIWVLEYTSGLILNVWLGLGTWDYTGKIFASVFQNQICLEMGLIFFAITPFIFWVDDIIRFYIFEENKPKNFLRYYLKLITFK